MKTTVTIANYASKTLAASKVSSVKKVYTGTILKLAQAIDDGQLGYYIGVKDTDVISFDFLKHLESHSFFTHTRDFSSQGGRAIDINLVNPITGRWMTGSSSGTAINVFLSINDIGVGTDGGGSVLAPALSLNLYAMISPLFDQHTLRKHSKTSTDGIVFTPSIGFMAKELVYLEKVIKTLIPIDYKEKEYAILYAKSPHLIHKNLSLNIDVRECHLKYDGLNRNSMMQELLAFDFDHQILITCEGPIDTLGYGDSVMGHYDTLTQEHQKNGHKYYLKVANMLGLSAFIVPSHNHGQGFLILCKSTPEAISQALLLVKKISYERSQLESSYFDCVKIIAKDVL